MNRSILRSWRLNVVAILVAAATALTILLSTRSHAPVPPLLTAGVALAAGGAVVGLKPGGAMVPLFAGTRVIASTDPAAARLAQAQRTWLASGTIPGKGTPNAELGTDALLDIHTLLQPNSALVAGWPAKWRYIWPRDAAFGAVALARTGHRDDALRVLEFLQKLEPAKGVFQARYLPDGSGIPDDRGEQTDGTGWVLWAADELVLASPPSARAQVLSALRPLIETSTAGALRITDRPGGLPLPSEDYWEVHDKRLSLGTAAPLALGLRSAADLQARLNDGGLSRSASQRATELAASITTQFGATGYPRYLGDDKPDASVAFLLPPFTATAPPAVLTAWRRASVLMRRPAGGLAPGAGWKQDGISWTPQTSLFALTAAAVGDPTTARTRLSWLSAHSTHYGSLPEKVTAAGAPAGPAPLIWSDALTLLTLTTLNPTTGQ